jgi:GTP cyclohydrolase II
VEMPKTPDEILAACDNTATREELEKKLIAKPDFPLEAFYCAGKGEYCKDPDLCVRLGAKAHLPTRFGEFDIYGFYDCKADKEHTAIVKGEGAGQESFPVRIHSQCHTGDVFGSLRCDCRDQLEAAIREVEKRGRGAVIYLKQEGRGIGLVNKIKAYRLQELGLDTVDANRYLGFPDDARDYSVAAKILGILGVSSVLLMTNNPDKVEKLTAAGVRIEGLIPVIIPPNEHDSGYLDAKRERMGHLI